MLGLSFSLWRVSKNNYMFLQMVRREGVGYNNFGKKLLFKNIINKT